MAKKTKTRKQKILSDIRRQTNPLPTIDTSTGKVVLQPSAPSVTPTHTAATIHFSYTHLKSDLMKTGFVTIGVIIIELIIHAFAKGV
jgi:hypothetical protein